MADIISFADFKRNKSKIKLFQADSNLSTLVSNYIYLENKYIKIKKSKLLNFLISNKKKVYLLEEINECRGLIALEVKSSYIRKRKSII